MESDGKTGKITSKTPMLIGEQDSLNLLSLKVKKALKREFHT